MILLRQKKFSSSSLKDLRKKWEKTGNGEDALNYMNAWVKDVYAPARREGRFESEPRDIGEAARNYLDSDEYRKKKLNQLGRETDKDIRKAVKGTKAESKVNKILNKSTKEMKEAAQKEYSKQSREIVPDDIVKKVKDGDGVIQKDHNGDWRIVSMKTKTNKSGKPEFWPQKSKDRKDMVNILKSYQANKHK